MPSFLPQEPRVLAALEHSGSRSLITVRSGVAMKIVEYAPEADADEDGKGEVLPARRAAEDEERREPGAA